MEKRKKQGIEFGSEVARRTGILNRLIRDGLTVDRMFEPLSGGDGK